MGKACQLYVETCHTCTKQKKLQTKQKAALCNYHAGNPMDRVHIDILGPFPVSDNGNRYIIISGVVGWEQMGMAFPHKKLSGNGVPTKETLIDIFSLLLLSYSYFSLLPCYNIPCTSNHVSKLDIRICKV